MLIISVIASDCAGVAYSS